MVYMVLGFELILLSSHFLFGWGYSLVMLFWTQGDFCHSDKISWDDDRQRFFIPALSFGAMFKGLS